MNETGDATPPSRISRVLLSVAILGYLGLQTWAVARPMEDWPLGSNAMFGYDVTKSSTLYDFEFVVTFPDGREHVLQPTQDLGYWSVAFERKFFISFYGSAASDFAQGSFGTGDSPEAYHQRLTDFHQRIARVMAERGHPVQAVRLELVRLDQTGKPHSRNTLLRTEINSTHGT